MDTEHLQPGTGPVTPTPQQLPPAQLTSRSVRCHFWLRWVGLEASLTMGGTRPASRSVCTTPAELWD